MVELFSSVDDLVAVLLRPKRLIAPSTWISPGKPGQRGFKLRASLGDGASALRGVGLEIGCHVESFRLPAHITLLAEFKSRARAMARIDIKGSPHENRHAVCRSWQFVSAGRTHFHDTALHVALTIEQLFSGDWDLPVARPIDDMPEDFSGAMERCGELLHIENLREVEEPQWQPQQLLF